MQSTEGAIVHRRTTRTTLATRLTRGAAAALATGLVLSACTAGDEVDTGIEDEAATGSDDGASGDPAADGGSLVAAISGTPDQFDPHATSAYPSFQVLENVYDTLVVPNPEDLSFEPSLATEWEQSEDGLTWTFTLRDDVVFHDGSELDSADVAYSFNRIIDEELANAFRFAQVESIDTPDPQTVVMNLSAPAPNLLANVGGFKGMAIIPEGAADELDLTTEAVGTGPFTLESADASGALLAANPDYWGEGPFVDEVEIRYVSEAAAALTGLRDGDIDWTDNVPAQDVDPLASDDALQLGQVGSVDYWYLAFNLADEPFSDLDFRRGVAFALNREDITQAARFDAATPNQTAIPSEAFWAIDYAPFDDDAEAQAEELLAAYDGTSFSLMVTDEFPETVISAQVIASQLEPYGITVEIETVDFQSWLDRQGQGDFDAFGLGWLGNLDPFDFYHAQHITDGGFNFHGYSNPEVDELLEAAATEADQEARRGIYEEAAQIIVDEVSYLYLYNPDVVQAWVPELEGYEIRPDRAVNFDTVTLTG